MEALGVIKTVDTVIKIAFPIIESITAKLAPEMKEFANRLYDLSAKYPKLENGAQAIEKGAEILTDILYALGISCDSADEIGIKAEKTEKSMSDFSSVEDYVKFLREEVEIDKEKLESLNPDEKMAYRTVGMAVEAAALGEKMGVNISPDFVLLMSKLRTVGDIAVEVADLISMVKSLKDSGVEETQNVCEYFSGKGDSDRVHTGQIIRTVFEAMFGDKGIEIIETIKNDERK